VRWVGDKEPAKDTAGHPGQASLLKDNADILNKMLFFSVLVIIHHTPPSRVLLIYIIIIKYILYFVNTEYIEFYLFLKLWW